MAEPSGFDAAIKDAGLAPGSAIRAAMEGPEQPPLIKLDDAAEELDDAASDRDAVQQQFGLVPPNVQRRIGRPRGATGKATREMIEFMLAQGYSDPLQWLFVQVSMTPAQIREAFKVDADKALDHQRQCALKLADFVHSRKPLEVSGPGGEPLPVYIAAFSDGGMRHVAPDIGAGAGDMGASSDASPMPANSIGYEGEAAEGQTPSGQTDATSD